MHFVVLAEHTAEVCPTSNAKTMELMKELGPRVPGIAEKNGVNMVAGPFVNREHVIVAILEADTADAVDGFLVESRLAHWNTVRVLPSHPIQEGMEEIQSGTPLF
jgi:uncharacterized protein with GYD domain